MQITIRNEREADHRAVEELTKRAFWNVNTPGADEHYLVHILRAHPDFVPELDLVLEADGVLSASILYTRAKLLAEDGAEKPVLTFGPLSVLPEYQRMGLGKKLMAYSFEKAAALGFDAVVIFGNPENYVSSGFKNGKRFGVGIGPEQYPVALLVRELREGALAGKKWVYKEGSAYELDESAAEAFDRDFPPMEKGYRPSQELFYIYSRSRVEF